MQKSKPHRILTEDPSGFFEDSWEGAKRLARNMYNEPVTQAMRIDPIATMSEIGQMGWETAKEAPGNLYRYAQENPHELWGNAVEAGVTRAMGPAGIVRYMAMQPTAANLTADSKFVPPLTNPGRATSKTGPLRASRFSSLKKAISRIFFALALMALLSSGSVDKPPVQPSP